MILSSAGSPSRRCTGSDSQPSGALSSGSAGPRQGASQRPLATSWSLRVSGPGVGFGLPARYPMILVPLIAVPLARCDPEDSCGSGGFRAALSCSRSFSPWLLYVTLGCCIPATVSRSSECGALLRLSRSWPGFRPRCLSLSRQTRRRRPRRGSLKEAQVVGRAGRDKRGFLRFGPYVGLKDGEAYLASFSLAAEGVDPDEIVAIIQVTAGETVLASRPLTGRQLQPLRLSYIDLPFAKPGGFIETRVYYRGRGTLRAGPISVQPIVAPQPAGPLPRLASCILVGSRNIPCRLAVCPSHDAQPTKMTLYEDNSEHLADP